MNRGVRLPLKEPRKIWNEMTEKEEEVAAREGSLVVESDKGQNKPVSARLTNRPWVSRPSPHTRLAIPSSETSQQITQTLWVNNCSPRVPSLATLLYVPAGHRHRILTHLWALFGCTSFLVKVCMCKLEHSLCGSLFPPGAAPDHVCLTFSTSTCLHLLIWEIPCCGCTILVPQSV